MCAVTTDPVSVVGVDHEAIEPHAYVAPPGDALGPGASRRDSPDILLGLPGNLSPLSLGTLVACSR
jgi:hypothetical protein